MLTVAAKNILQIEERFGPLLHNLVLIHPLAALCHCESLLKLESPWPNFPHNPTHFVCKHFPYVPYVNSGEPLPLLLLSLWLEEFTLFNRWSSTRGIQKTITNNLVQVCVLNELILFYSTMLADMFVILISEFGEAQQCFLFVCYWYIIGSSKSASTRQTDINMLYSLYDMNTHRNHELNSY